MHYHRPWLLDCRVRKGNGYFQPGMGTGRRLSPRTRRRRLADFAEASFGSFRGRLGWVGRTSRRGPQSEDEIKPIDWLVPVS